MSTKANGHLIGLTVVDDFSVVFEGAQSAEYAGQISDYSDRDRVSLFEECDREGLKALFEEA